MLRIALATAALATAALALAPSVGAIPEPQVPCYPDFYGGTVCVVGEEPAPCFVLVAYNPDPRHPFYPVAVTPVYCRGEDGERDQVTPCTGVDPQVLGFNPPYC